jgi:hypothetical protein
MITLLLLTKLANAQDYSPIKKGEVSPITGTVLAQNAMATIIAKCDADVSTEKVKAKYELDKLQTTCDLNEEKLQYDLDAQSRTSKQIIEIKDQELEKAYEIIKNNSKKNTSLWLGIGFTAGLVTSFGVIYGYEQVQ